MARYKIMVESSKLWLKWVKNLVSRRMPRLFTPHKTDLRRRTELQPVKSPNGLLYPRVEEKQRTHFGDDIENTDKTSSAPYVTTRRDSFIPYSH